MDDRLQLFPGPCERCNRIDYLYRTTGLCVRCKQGSARATQQDARQNARRRTP